MTKKAAFSLEAICHAAVDKEEHAEDQNGGGLTSTSGDRDLRVQFDEPSRSHKPGGVASTLVGLSKAGRRATVHVPGDWTVESETVHPGFEPSKAVFYTDGGLVKWTARGQRKGLAPKVITFDETDKPIRQPLREIRYWGWDYHDVSWWVAQMFLVGSIAWTINGYLGFFRPGNNPSLDGKIGAWIGFVGGVLFQVGAYFGFLEALNREEEVHQYEPESATHMPANNRTSFMRRASGRGAGVQSYFVSDDPKETDALIKNGQHEHEPWHWWGYRWNEIGFVAGFIQLLGATIFSIAVVAELPGIISGTYAENYLVWDLLVWVPFFLGSVCFVLASWLMLLEEQDNWWTPDPSSLGWHVAVWNLVGSLGFLASSTFGFLAYPCACFQKYGTDLSTFWGSFAFIVASYLTLLETLNKVHH